MGAWVMINADWYNSQHGPLSGGRSPGGEKGGLFSHPICESSPIGSIGRLLERNDS